MNDRTSALHAEAVRHHQAGHVRKAVAAYRAAIALQPDFAEGLGNLGGLLRSLGHPLMALPALTAAARLAPSSEAHIFLAAALQDTGRLDEAMTQYDEAARLAAPGFESPLANKALLQLEMGQVANALSTLDQALTVNPASAHAWFLRGHVKKFAADDPDLTKMESVLADLPETGASALARTLLHFTLGKAWMDIGNGDRAFSHLNAGNRLKRSTLRYSADATRRWMASIGQAFTPDLIQRLTGAGDPSPAPVFIIGMPRSGTTLVEQILSSHQEMLGVGESPLMDQLAKSFPGDGSPPVGYPALLSDLSPADLNRLGRTYVAAISGGSAHSRIIDKMPTNFLYAGLIHLMLPNARIIHCRRDPLDTCVSCYSKHFIAGVEFSYDLAELGAFYRDYQNLMAVWREILPPDRFLEIDYEDVVGDVESQARRMVAFCGLDWDASCLDFHLNRRQVRTASNLEVRRPIHRDSVQRWKTYESHLGPLIESLMLPDVR
jgi:tetratricopeptide (TPR) repeat protein